MKNCETKVFGKTLEMFDFKLLRVLNGWLSEFEFPMSCLIVHLGNS